MPFAAEAAATQVAGSKRPSGNDLFREMVMSGSAPATSSSLPSLAKRQSVGDSDDGGSVDWQQLFTHENRAYFLHVPTGRGQWNRPALLAKAQEAVDADARAGAPSSSAAAAAGDAAVGAAAEDPATYSHTRVPALHSRVIRCSGTACTPSATLTWLAPKTHCASPPHPQPLAAPPPSPNPFSAESQLLRFAHAVKSTVMPCYPRYSKSVRAGAPVESHREQAETYRQCAASQCRCSMLSRVQHPAGRYAAQYNYGAWQLVSRKIYYPGRLICAVLHQHPYQHCFQEAAAATRKMTVDGPGHTPAAAAEPSVVVDKMQSVSRVCACYCACL
jgi:hypothetical protein